MILRHQIWHVSSFQWSFFFADSSWNLPLLFFFRGGGLKKNIFWKMARQNTHLLKKIPEILNKEESVWKVRSHNLKLFVFFDSKKSSFTMLIHKQSLRSKIFCLPGVTRTEDTLFSLWKNIYTSATSWKLTTHFLKATQVIPWKSKAIWSIVFWDCSELSLLSFATVILEGGASHYVYGRWESTNLLAYLLQKGTGHDYDSNICSLLFIPC